MRSYYVRTIMGITMAAFSTPAFAIGPASMARPSFSESTISVQRATLAPLAYVKYCLDNKTDCAQGSGSARIDVTSTLRRQLRQVNAQVNKAIKPVNDRSGQDVWQADVSRGDCEDYVLTKRKRLIELGWSSNALRIAIVYTPQNEGHAVLVVSTVTGDLVLDNRHNAVLDWRDTDLRWVKIQSSDNPMKWNEI